MFIKQHEPGGQRGHSSRQLSRDKTDRVLTAWMDGRGGKEGKKDGKAGTAKRVEEREKGGKGVQTGSRRTHGNCDVGFVQVFLGATKRPKKWPTLCKVVDCSITNKGSGPSLF
ncbi:hypothetical protein NQZ68_011007 [Dissostichus eleginoides]|nr:hypothetical protein NQZ68_011007 [Dissostichus eleginoides]